MRWRFHISDNRWVNNKDHFFFWKISRSTAISYKKEAKPDYDVKVKTSTSFCTFSEFDHTSWERTVVITYIFYAMHWHILPRPQLLVNQNGNLSYCTKEEIKRTRKPTSWCQRFYQKNHIWTVLQLYSKSGAFYPSFFVFYSPFKFWITAIL
jgi:hypothetical protein